MRKGFCLTSDEAKDSFVGLRIKSGKPEVVFPHGYFLSDSDKERRKDVFRLLAVLSRFSALHQGNNLTNAKNELYQFPITSYQFVIQDFLANGYYIENEKNYISSHRGKINWKKTIQQEQPQIDRNNVVYLNYRVLKNQIKEDSLLTQIHKYCVYQSFYMFGWLYLSSSFLPQPPNYNLDKTVAVSVLNNAFGNTFNDYKRRLFKSMINIIEIGNDYAGRDFSVGVEKFENVWENLIDYVFGEEDKDKYFPHAVWHIIKSGKFHTSSALKQDTVMKHAGKIYVLDAKYYQFGITGLPSDLPATASIQKQITYGKHIAEQMNEVPTDNVYNAFIIPYCAYDGEKYKFVSIGTADWESYSENTHNYAYVLGILLDTKWLMTEYVRHNEQEIEDLAVLIDNSLLSYRTNFINQGKY